MGLPLEITNGQVLNYDYTGGVQSIMLPPGSYKLECWGAQGGYRSNATYGGKGGYSVGELTLNEETTLYVQVGRSGGYAGDSVYTIETSGGYNGGGKRDSSNPGGGGATDIRIGQNSLYARVIVAGGGGSDGANNKKGMYGGGESGGSSTEGYGTGGFGGTQTGVSDSSWQTTNQSENTSSQSDAYAGFGFGGNGVTYGGGYGGAGGGGWYGGSGAYPDSSSDDDRGGGGGSGYIYTSSTASNYPSGCLLNSSYYLTNAQTIAGNTSFPSPTSGSTETGHSGNGYARITVLTVKSPIKIKKGQIFNCEFSGGVEKGTFPAGTYKLEVWGAQGGNYNIHYGGAGGYSVGTLTIIENTDFYICVGGQPVPVSADRVVTPGGYNGGGAGFNRYYNSTYTLGQGGGGGTDIRIGQDSLYARVIVAGGGGGSASNGDEKVTKYGGGLTGGCVSANFAGTQTSGGVGDAGSFGKGGAAPTGGDNYKYGPGGGGGGWYGGGVSTSYSDSETDLKTYNGGGSGYVYTANTATNYPSGCLLNSTYYLTEATTIGGNESFPSTNGGTETGHKGNGYARITVLSVKSPISTPIHANGQWHDCNEIFVKVNGVWKACTNAYVKVGGAWKECIENTISNVTTYELSKFGSYVNTVKVNGTAVTLPMQVATGATIEVTSTGYDASAYSMIWSGPTPTSTHTTSSGSTTARIVTFVMPSEDIIIRFDRRTVSSGTTYTISKGNNVASMFINNGSSITTSTNAKPGDTITVHSNSFSTSTVSAITWAGTGVPTANISYNNYVIRGSNRYRKITFTMPANNVTTAFRKTSSGGSTDM